MNSHDMLLSVDRGVAVSFVLVDILIVDLQLQVGTANYSCGYLVSFKVPTRVISCIILAHTRARVILS